MSVLRFHRSLMVLVFASLPLLLASMCTEEEVVTAVEEEEEEFTKNILLFAANMAPRECLHLFGPGETFPCCRVCNVNDFASAGESRTAGAVTLKKGASVQFSVGQNEVILQRQNCLVTGTEDDTYSVRHERTGINHTIDCTGSGW